MRLRNQGLLRITGRYWYMMSRSPHTMCLPILTLKVLPAPVSHLCLTRAIPCLNRLFSPLILQPCYIFHALLTRKVCIPQTSDSTLGLRENCPLLIYLNYLVKGACYIHTYSTHDSSAHTNVSFGTAYNHVTVTPPFFSQRP